MIKTCEDLESGTCEDLESVTHEDPKSGTYEVLEFEIREDRELQ
jgi:hypothetical protein